MLTVLAIALLASVAVHLALIAWTWWGTRSVTKRLVASAQAHEAAEREHRNVVANLNRVLESECPRCSILSATLQVERQRAGATRS